MGSFTATQVTAIKAAIAADPAMATITQTPSGPEVIASLFNTAEPAYFVWRTDVAVDEIMKNGMDWTRVDNLSIGKARIWEWMSKLGTFNAAKPNIRAGIDATWVGTTADLAVRDAVYVHCKRNATRLEKLLTTGAGTLITPSLLVYAGKVGAQEMSDIIGAQ